MMDIACEKCGGKLVIATRYGLSETPFTCGHYSGTRQVEALYGEEKAASLAVDCNIRVFDKITPLKGIPPLSL
jgi:hypothetical protein